MILLKSSSEWKGIAIFPLPFEATLMSTFAPKKLANVFFCSVAISNDFVAAVLLDFGFNYKYYTSKNYT